MGSTKCECWTSNPFTSGNITIVSCWEKGKTRLYTSKEVYSLKMDGVSCSELFSPILTLQQ